MKGDLFQEVEGEFRKIGVGIGSFQLERAATGLRYFGEAAAHAGWVARGYAETTRAAFKLLARRLLLRRQSILKARGRNWRTVRA